MAYSASMLLKAVDQISPTLNKVKAGMQGLTKTAISGVKGIGSLGAGMKTFLSGYAGLSAVQGVQASFNTLVDFSEQFQGVKSVAEVTGVSFEQLEKQAKELGRTTRYTATQAAGAQYFLAKAGFDTQKIYDSMPDTLLLASAANLDIAQSADIVTNIMAGYNIQASELGTAVDSLAKSFSSANTDLVELGNAMKYAGPVASGFGIKFNEAAAALGMLGDAGFKGTLGGTALRGALVRLAAPTKKVARYIRALKLDIYDSKGNLKSLADIVEQFEKRNVSAAQSMVIFGQRAGPAMLQLISKGSDRLREFTATLDKSSGFAKKVADTRLEGLYGSWVKLKSAIEGLVQSIGDSGLVDALSAVMDVITGLANAISWLLELLGKLPWYLKPLEVVKKYSGAVGELVGSIAGAFTSQNHNLLVNNQEKMIVAQENVRRMQANQKPMTYEETKALLESKGLDIGKLEIKLDINDKNGQVGKVEAKTANTNAKQVDFNVGRSTAGHR